MITNHKFVAWGGIGKCLVCGESITEHAEESVLITSEIFLNHSTQKEREDVVILEKLRMNKQLLADAEKKLKDTNEEINEAFDKYMDSSKRTSEAIDELQTRLIIFSVACFALAAFMLARIFIFRI